MMSDEQVTPEALLDACHEARDLAVAAGADEAEVMAAWGTSQSVEFEKNDLQIAISDDETVYGVRVIKDNKLGFASTNDFSTIHETVSDALALSAASVPDPLHSLPHARPLVDVPGRFHQDICELDVARVTEMAAAFLARVRELDGRVSVDSGSVAAGQGASAIASSCGVAASTRGTHLSCYLFGMAVEGEQVGSFGVAGSASRGFEGFEEKIAQCAAQFVDKTLGALHPQKGVSYHGDVVFTPEATSSLLIGNLLGMLNPGAIRKGKSPLAGKVGEAVASPLLSLVDDATVPGELESSCFDREGMPRRRQSVIEDGVLQSIPYNQYEAVAAGVEGGSTGHASGGAENLPAVSFPRIQMAAGQESVSNLLESTGPLMIVTRFSGSTNGVTGEFSGVVKSGFLIENGEKRPVSEVLIAGNLLDLYRNINAVSSETERVFGRVPYPWVRAGGISVTAG